MKKIVRKAAALLLAAGMSITIAACGSAQTGSTASNGTASETSTASASDGKIINIGASDSLGFVNPLLMDWTFINYYTISQEFLPLVRLNSDYSLDYCVAESITSDDNLHFNIKIRDDAVWSDGEPITSDDVIFTILRMTSPEIANANFDFSLFEGMDENGQSPEGAESIDGLVKIDDKNLEINLTQVEALNTLSNNLLSWICILPYHVLKDIPADELKSYDWFNAPTVVSGPYAIVDHDSEHYITFKANENYYLGAPKVETLNIRIVQPSEMLAGLQSGDIDIILPACGNITSEDKTAIEALDGFKSVYADPITDEMTFINTRKITDAKVRKAIVYAIDRQTIVDGLLNGHGEVTDGFLCTSSPYYDSTLENIPYDPEQAKALLDEAGWDGSQQIEYYVSSSDDGAVKAAQIMKEELAEVGITLNIHTVDFATLMSVGGTDEVDMFSVQYTITPNDYYVDLQGLVDMDESWTGGYHNDALHQALLDTQTAKTDDELKAAYRTIDDAVVDEVPMFSLYFMSNLGVVSDRLVNAEPTFYGPLNNVQDWDVQ